MKREVDFLIEQLKDVFEGDPWFGRNAKALLSEVDETIAFEKPNGQHSIVELVWHMVNWRQFAISRTKPSGEDLHHFEQNDWRDLDHSDRTLWQQGLQMLFETQEQLVLILQDADDHLLNENVSERNYSNRKLLNGILQHDIYHLGQIAYIVKMTKEQRPIPNNQTSQQ